MRTCLRAHMAPLTFFSLLILLAGSPGALGVWTLHKVLGQKGASITVPCHYDPKYKDNTKYWCRGYQWATCLVMARSTSTQSGGKVSIRDESSQQLFIVTMRNLTERDTNKYWCAVKIGSIVKPDVKASVFLTVTAGSVGLSVLDNMVAGVAGDSVTVRCFYRDRYALSPRKWCRSSDWGSCVTAGEARANRVLISDNGTGVFAVTLKALTEKDQGWYWCASGDAQVPIHITVMTPATAASAVSAVPPPPTREGSSDLPITLPAGVSTLPSRGEIPAGSNLPSMRESKTVSTLPSTTESPVGSTHPTVREPAVVSPLPVRTSSVGSALLTTGFTVLHPNSSPLTKWTGTTKTTPSSPLTSAGLTDRDFQKEHRSHVTQSFWIIGAILLILATVVLVAWKWRHQRDMKSSCEMEEIVTNLTVDVEDESNHTDPDVVL
ncbi:hepatitis A virus cellular receptor 1-like isoform X2 [Scleropages formosus]|uniref:hepatitis A virus cellular receptor 1-like isoform X2 n=1 Tax=Scleropages formosus TaxID=113540 RepID=UPI0008786861|nr:hepatitis A virus cellular receptor 1-like isoform X2 [Scleropages formosus]